MNLAQVNNNDKSDKGPSKLERAAQMLGMISTVANIGGGLKGLAGSQIAQSRMSDLIAAPKMNAGFGSGPYDPAKYSLGKTTKWL